MRQEISKSNFKAHALEIMRSVEDTGEDVVITAHGKRSLVITQYKDTTFSPLEKLQGSVLSYTDPIAPIAEDDWDLA
ncbi:type II toxin-antitoxin system prevent-host-death family antitoxin [Agaribacter flavus]|uniref:Antitoxin n=1 Tax=Agaribacter flavus TaxID=1902781 RepID=A0ABV7FRC2_9ALTE